MDDGSSCVGLTDANEKVIYLDRDIVDDGVAWVFWHEYCHAMLYETGVTVNSGGLSDLAEELICDSYADCMTLDKTVRFKRSKK
jgi:hypothetical protein